MCNRHTVLGQLFTCFSGFSENCMMKLGHSDENKIQIILIHERFLLIFREVTTNLTICKCIFFVSY